MMKTQPLDNLGRLLAVRHAKAFREELRDMGLALYVPPHWDNLTDAELQHAMEWLHNQPNMHLRPDGRWELTA